MKYVIINTADIFEIIKLVMFDIRIHGSLWCEGNMSSDDLKVLDDNGYWYRIL